MIRAENLCYSYNGSVYVLENIDLHITPGEYVSVVGDNGSGKSTLLRLILKFIKPSGGSVSTAARRIGYVPQKKDSADSGFPITVLEMLDSYRRLLGIKERGAAGEMLEKVGMSGEGGSLMGNLSGGQSQKIMIARALLGGPDLLILDEPSTSVDLCSQNEIYGFLKKISQERGITVVSAEHNLDAVIENSTLIYHLRDRRGHLCTPEQYAEEILGRRGAGTED
ncbi:MAG: metal ABC transporter ATP-binding protein [Synergistaceae bacterium]|nr:metal ABC transporter ATP-binding protein [Synergistaceae bacterium]